MYPPPFEYLRPRSIREAVELLRRHGEEAKLLAGGQSLVPMMKLRVARPKYLVDIHRIAGLNYIRQEDGAICIGATTRHVEIEQSPLIREKLSMLAQAAGEIGDAQVRNRGTIGGGLAEADPVGDYGPVALALDARMKCVRPSGVREIPATEFFTFAYTTALESDEMLMEIIFPMPPQGSAGVYHKLEKVAGDFAIAAAAVQLAVDRNGACAAIGIGVSGGGPVPQKPVAAENLLRGKRIAPELIDHAARTIQDDAEPIEDLRGSAAYKKKALGAVVRRAIAEAAALHKK
jgi:carbon-monoxide dehydrogenase medium subunit